MICIKKGTSSGLSLRRPPLVIWSLRKREGCGLANWGSRGPYRETYGPTELVDLDRTFPGTVFHSSRPYRTVPYQSLVPLFAYTPYWHILVHHTYMLESPHIHTCYWCATQGAPHIHATRVYQGTQSNKRNTLTGKIFPLRLCFTFHSTPPPT